MALSIEEKEYNKKLRSFKAQVNKNIKENGVRNAVFILQQAEKAGGDNLKTFGLNPVDCIDYLKVIIEDYRHTLPKNNFQENQTSIL